MTAPTLAAYASEIAALAAQGAPSVAAVHARNRWSSAFYWKLDTLVTASEALMARKDETVTVIGANGGKAEGRVLGRDPSTDVALIHTSATGTPLQAASKASSLGDAVVALGRSRHGATLAAGLVSLAGPAWRSMRGGEIAARLWLDLNLRPHAEGGPVLDSSGGFLGMAVYGPRRAAIVIPYATIERVAPEIAAHGRARRGYLGVGVQPVPIQASSHDMGLMVVSLDDKGPARTAGVLQGDILVSVAGEAVPSIRALARALTGSRIGTAAPVELVRAGERKTLTATVGEAP